MDADVPEGRTRTLAGPGQPEPDGPAVPRPARRRPAPSTVVFLLALLVGTALRLRLALSLSGEMNSDQAVVYLMAKRMSEGEFEAYYWGQRYGGTLTTAVLAALFAVFGAHLWLLPAVVTLTGLGLVLMVRHTAKHAWGTGAGNLAGGLLALGPPGFIILTITNEAGFYGLGMLLSVLALRLAMAMRERPTARNAALLALTAGVAMWVSPFSFLGVVPALVVSLRTLLQHPRLLVPGVAGFLPGGLLVLASAFRDPLPVDTVGTTVERLNGAVTAVWPAIFTVLTPFPLESKEGALLGGAFFVICATGLAVRVLLRKDRLLTGLLLQLTLWPLFLTASGSLTDPPSWRYGFMLLPALALVLAPLGKRFWVLGLPLLLAWGGVFVAGVLTSTDGLPPRPCPLFSYPNQELARLLAAEGRRAIWADYWISYRLSAETDERVTADPVHYSRDDGYTELAERAEQTTVVVFTGLNNDKEMLAFTQGRTDVERTAVQHYTVYAFEGNLSRAELPPMVATPAAADPFTPVGACD